MVTEVFVHSTVAELPYGTHPTLETTGTLAGVFHDIAGDLFVFGDGPGGSSIKVRGRGCRDWRGRQLYRSIARRCGCSDCDRALDLAGSANARGVGGFVFPIDDFRSAFRFCSGIVFVIRTEPFGRGDLGVSRLRLGYPDIEFKPLHFSLPFHFGRDGPSPF